MEKCVIKIHELPHHQGLPLPSYASAQAAGMDIPAALEQALLLPPGERVLIPTGIALELPQGFEAQIRPRSGLALKQGITVLNSPGTIDADYRGELMILLINLGRETFLLERGMRIAQMVIAPVVQGELVPWCQLANSGRGAGGFGHSGL